MKTAVPTDSISMLTYFDADQEGRPLGARDARLVRQGFAQVSSAPDATAAIFYKRLFDLDPNLRPLLKNNAERGRQLLQLIEAAVGLLDRPEALAPTLEGLGRRHAGYGIRDEHYDTVEVALILTLQQELGPAFTKEARSAWIALFDLIATTLKRATAAELDLSGAQELATAV